MIRVAAVVVVVVVVVSERRRKPEMITSTSSSNEKLREMHYFEGGLSSIVIGLIQQSWVDLYKVNPIANG